LHNTWRSLSKGEWPSGETVKKGKGVWFGHVGREDGISGQDIPFNGSAKTAGEDPRPRKVHHDPGCPDECWSLLFATLNAYATRFTMNFQIIARK
jgi:hypothetical protein